MKTARFGGPSSGEYGPMQGHALPHRSAGPPAPGPNGLPPPSFSHAFSQGNHNPFAVTGNVNGLAAGFGMNTIGSGGTGLGSKEAQEGFAYGAQLQAREQSQGAKTHLRMKQAGRAATDARIRDVWASNMREEMDLLEQLVEHFPFISMDTEFPGIVARPMGKFTTKSDYHYQCLRCNVDILKVIQLGISLFDENGNSPPAALSDIPGISASASLRARPCPTTWQFNFRFSLDQDMYNDASIVFLQDAGIDLKRFEREGIEPHRFGSRLITSGLVHFDEVRWISFHSGYDFAYIVKLMNCNELPEEEIDYRRLLRLYFPSIYDIKFMIHSAQRTQRINNDQILSTEALNHLNNLVQKGGLQHLADELHVRRVGHAHCAGSDALLTGKTFWEVKDKIFGGSIDDKRYLGQVWGLNVASTGVSAPNPQHDHHTTSTTPNLNGATIYHHKPSSSASHHPSQSGKPPSTPVNVHAGPASTPGHQTQPSRDSNPSSGGVGSWTPGGGGGVFGAFRRS